MDFFWFHEIYHPIVKGKTGKLNKLNVKMCISFQSNFSQRTTFLMALLVIAFIGCAKTNEHRLIIPYTPTPITIDGQLTEKIWKTSAVIDGLAPSLNKNYQNTIDSIPTQIRVLWDKNFLYLAFKCSDGDIYADSNAKRDENIYKFDVIEIFIDPVGNQKQYWEIQVSPFNQILDLIFIATEKPEYDSNSVLKYNWRKKYLYSFREYNIPNLETSTKRYDNEWIVELAIPAKALLKPLGKEKFSQQVIRANFLRYDHQPTKTIKRNLIHMNWAPVLHGCPHISPSAMGFLELSGLN